MSIPVSRVHSSYRSAMADLTAETQPTWMQWVGRVFTVLPALAFVPSGVMKVTHAAKVMEGLHDQMHVSPEAITAIGIVELTCLVLYLVPQTAVLGATLLTGYLGGAVMVHVLGHQPVVLPILIGVIVWGGIWLRDPRVRALTPLRKLP